MSAEGDGGRLLRIDNFLVPGLRCVLKGGLEHVEHLASLADLLLSGN
jgi:hypothetical protein